MKSSHVTEQSVAAVVVAYLEAMGADVYQEVEVPGGVADIVARVRAELWIVEVKTSLSLALLFQAMERRRLAHRVFIAAPYSRNFRDVGVVCEALGIGLFEVKVPSDYETWRTPEVIERVESRRWNTRPVALAADLEPGHKTHAKAGAIGAGGRWTPFRSTCEELARVVAAEPGIALKQAIEKIKHHYRTPASARSSIAHWLERGKVPGVRLEYQATPHATTPKLFPVERKDTTP